MADATSKAQSTTTPWGDDKIYRGLAAVAGTYYAGTMIGLNSDGNAVKASAATALVFDGLMANSPPITVESADLAGDKRVLVERPWRLQMKIASAAAGDEGKPVYALYDNEVTYANTGALLHVGWVDKFISATEVLIRPVYHAPDRPRLCVAADDGAIGVKEGTVVITKAGVAALTLANPTATLDDGKVLTILSVTANAHTVSNAAGAGFNGGGTGADIGTFAAAKGNHLVLMAYQGVWYVVENAGVTLA